jgi:predicted metalloprotease with PDZ domain
VQASYDAWIKHYRPDETTANTTVSYYLKGSVVGFLLDLELRKRTSGERSLDDLVRLLFQRHGGAPGLPEGGVEAGALELVPESERASLQSWLDQALRQPVDLDLSALAAVGLEAMVRPAEGSDDKGSASEDAPELSPAQQPRAVLGASLRERAGLCEVTHVVEGGAAQRAGLLVGDEIAALDGFRSEVRARLSRGQPGQLVRLSLFRMDELLEITVALAATPADTVTLHPVPLASPRLRALREQWLGGRWPEGAA